MSLFLQGQAFTLKYFRPLIQMLVFVFLALLPVFSLSHAVRCRLAFVRPRASPALASMFFLFLTELLAGSLFPLRCPACRPRDLISKLSSGLSPCVIDGGEAFSTFPVRSWMTKRVPFRKAVDFPLIFPLSMNTPFPRPIHC